MSDDIVTRLRKAVCWCNDFDGRCETCQAADEIERLQERNEWLDSHVGALIIGFRENKAEIERLRAELKSQTFWAELLSRDKCYCVPEDIGMCMACAYRQTTRQNEEASHD